MEKTLLVAAAAEGADGSSSFALMFFFPLGMYLESGLPNWPVK
jgi:hypothetical protein